MTGGERQVPLGILFRQPLILAAWWYQEGLFSSLHVVRDVAGDEFAIIVVFNAWSVVHRQPGGQLTQLRSEYDDYRRVCPRHQIIFAANDAAEQAILRSYGMAAEVFNHNAFYVDFETFNVTTMPKRYDAIYNAQIRPFKRLELMSDLSNACVVSASVDAEYTQNLPAALRGFYYPNGSPFDGGGHCGLGRTEIAMLCNASRVGLCLSAFEGAMLSSAEYLLCGIPIVSTPSVGGRDQLFDSDYVAIVEPMPAAVRAGVAEMAARNLDPLKIRATTLAKIFSIRTALLNHLLGVCAETEVRADERQLAAAILPVQAFPWDLFNHAKLAQAIGRDARAASGPEPQTGTILDLFPDLRGIIEGNHLAQGCGKPVLMLATTAGAGGSYLAAALAAACGMTGVGAEIFNPRGPVQRLKAAHQVALFSEYLRSIAEQPGPYGIFAASWPDFSIFSRLYRQMFPDLKIIYLDRLDVVAQGVAAWRTGISAAAETAFDPQAVCDLIDTIEAETQAWKRLFETEGLQPLRLSYEGFADDTAAAVRYVGEHFGLTLNAEIGPEMGSLLAADSQNEEWMEQVRDYRSGRGGKLP